MPLVDAALKLAILTFAGCSLTSTATHGAWPPRGFPPTRAAASPGVEEVNRFRASVGVQFGECDSPGCLSEAARSCSPAHFFKSHFTVEGTSAFFDYFVVPRGDFGKEACDVHVLADFSADYWGGCKVALRVCPNLDAAESDDPEAQGCGPGKTLRKLEPCTDPYAEEGADPSCPAN